LCGLPGNLGETPFDLWVRVSENFTQTAFNIPVTAVAMSTELINFIEKHVVKRSLAYGDVAWHPPC
jgi:hypothetical protein